MHVTLVNEGWSNDQLFMGLLTISLLLSSILDKGLRDCYCGCRLNVNGTFNNIQVVYVHEAIYLLIWFIKYEFFNEVVREICVILFYYIYIYIYIYTPVYKNIAISEIYIIYIYNYQKET